MTMRALASTTMRSALFAIAAAIAAFPGTAARAQDAGSGTDTAAGDGGDAAGTDGGGAEDPALAEAMERFGDAQAFFERGDHRAALAELQRVYQLLEGSENQYIVLYNLGRVYEELHRYDLAVGAFQAYLDTSPADAPDRSDAEASLRALERLLGTIVVSIDIEHAEVWIGEWQVGEAPGEIPVPSGVHQLELRAEGHETVRRQIEVTARSRVELSVSMPALSDFRGVDPALFVSSTVLAGLAAIAGAVLGGTAMSLHDSAEACATQVGCRLDVGARRREISDLALGADVLFGAAGLFAITSIVLVFVTDWSGGAPRSGETAAPASAFRLLPAVGAGGGSLTVVGSF